MPVFKLCMKIFLRNWITIAIYVGIFLAISITIAMTSHEEKTTGTFTQQKAKIAFIAEEKTPLVDGFRAALAQNVDFVPLPDQKEKLQDALFFRQVTYILRIPKGFTDSVLNGGAMKIEKTVVPNSVENTYVDLNVRQYWHLAGLYAKYDPGISQQQLVDQLKQNLSGKTPVTVQAHEKAKTANSFSMYYFNFMAYSLTAVLIMGISTVMIVFNRKDLRRRIFCAPISTSRLNMQLILANLLFAAAALAVLVGFCGFLDPASFATANMIYFILNAAAFTACMASLSFFIGTLMDSLDVVNAVCNVLSLGPCFLSGVFVPQQFLNDTVLKIASFTPTYWYVNANSAIARLTEFNRNSLASIFSSMGVMLMFTAVFIALSLVVAKRKRLMN